MPLTSFSSTGKRIALGGGSALLGGGCLLLLLKGGVVLFLLGLVVWYMPRDNDAPANQLTVVQGTVTDGDTGRPVPGARLAIMASRPHTNEYDETGDSTRTDAQGRYRLRFRNRPALYYRVYFDTEIPNEMSDDARYAFAEADYQSLTNPGSQDNMSATERNLTLGSVNTVDFRPSERHTIAMHTHNHNRTGYQFMQLPSGYQVHLDNRDTTIYLTLYSPPARGITIRYSDYHGKQAGVHDTTVALVLLNPEAPFPDTVQATLTPVR